MIIFQNENLLRLILSSISLYEARLLFHNMNNKTINQTILKILNYEDIFKSMGKSKLAIIEQCGETAPLAVLPNGNIVLTEHNTIRIWDLYTNTFLNTLNTLNAENEVIFITALLDNSVAICLQNCTVKIWNIFEDCVITTKFEAYKEFISALLLPNGNIASIAENYNDENDTILILDSKNKYECFKALDLEDMRKRHLPDRLFPISNEMFASYCSEYPSILIWAIGNDYQCLKNLVGEISSICLIDNALLIGSYEGVHIYDTTKNFEYLYRLPGHKREREIISLLYDEKNKLLLSASDKIILVWDVTHGFHCIKKIMARDITGLVFLRNSYFAICHKGGVSIWDLVRLGYIGKLDGQGPINQLCLVDDARVVTCVCKGAATIWGY
jgi:WD40 repeat protein